MDDVVIIKLADHGTSLGTRELGSELREKTHALIKNSLKKVLFDFTNVHVISSGFADELFGKLYAELGAETFKEHIKINQFSHEDDKKVILLIIKSAIEYRDSNPRKSA